MTSPDPRSLMAPTNTLRDQLRASIKDLDTARREEWPDRVCRNCGCETSRGHAYTDEDGNREYSCRGVKCDTCRGTVEAIDLDDGVCLACRTNAVIVERMESLGITIIGEARAVDKAVGVLNASARHEPRPVPLVRLGQGDFTRDYTPNQEG